MEATQRLLDRAARAAVLFGAVMIGLMAVHVALDVTLRYALNAPLPGAVIFAPLAFVQSKREHFFAEIVTQRWPEPVIRALDILCLVVTGLVLVFLTWRTGAYALTFTRSGAAVETGYFTIPTWPSRWFVPAGLGFMALYAFLQAARLTLGGTRRA